MVEKIRRGDSVPFTQIVNAMLCDPNLSLKAKGLLGYMLSKPQDWQFNIRAISGEIRESKNTVQKILVELSELGYVHRSSNRDDRGRITSWEYTVYQSPHPKNGNLDK